MIEVLMGLLSLYAVLTFIYLLLSLIVSTQERRNKR